VKSKKPDLINELRERIVPVAGDLIIPKLGIKPEIRKQITSEV